MAARKLSLAWSCTEAPAMLKVAFATADRTHVDQHFGAATGFAIYQLDGERAQLVELAEFAEEGMDGNEGKLAAKIAALTGCAAVYCLAVGGSAVRDGGVPWIDKALKKEADADRFARMAEEGWQE